MMKLGEKHILWNGGFFAKTNCRRVKDLRERQEKLLKHSLRLLTNATAMIFTGTLFVGGSYLFFVKLAEYGW